MSMERSFMKREEKALERVVNDGPLVSVSVVSVYFMGYLVSIISSLSIISI